jgi:hypothetical protein
MIMRSFATEFHFDNLETQDINVITRWYRNESAMSVARKAYASIETLNRRMEMDISPIDGVYAPKNKHTATMTM